MTSYLQNYNSYTRFKLCTRNAFVAIMNHTKFYFNRCMVTMILASGPLSLPGLIGLSSDPRNNCSNVRFSLVKSAEN